MTSIHHILIKAILLILGFFFAGGTLHAEGNCPAGYSPIGATDGQTGTQGCAPTPGYNQVPTAHWENRWGAMATDDVKGVVRSAVGASNRDQAESKALAGCKADGGLRCKVELAYYNQCAAMTVGDNNHNITSAATLNEAIQLSLKTCSSATDHCHVYRTACSLPAQLQ